MRRIASLLGAMIVLAQGTVHAQDQVETDVGFLRLVNLVGVGEGNLDVTMDGKNHWGDGFKLGDRTGGFKMKAGQIDFLLRKEGCESAKRSIDVVRGKTVTLVIYADPVRNDDGKIETWELKMATLSQRSEPDGLFFTIVSFVDEEEVVFDVVDSLSGKKQRVVAPKRKATRVQVTHGLVNVRISHEGKLLKNLSTRRRGNYVVMFYTDAEGEKQNVTFYDRKFVIGN